MTDNDGVLVSAPHPEIPRTKRELEQLCKALETAQEQMLSLPRKSPERKALKAYIRQLDQQCSVGAAGLREKNLSGNSLREEWAHNLFSSYSDHTNHIRFIGFVAVMAHFDALTGGGQAASVSKEELTGIWKEDLGVEGDKMTEGQFELWIKLFLGQMKEEEFISVVQKLIHTNEHFVGNGLFNSADRLEIVDMLFDAVDLDSSGSLSLDEFTQLLKSLDDLITEEDVRASFKATGIAEGQSLRKHHFYRWVHGTFGHLQDDDFFEELDDLLEELREFKIPLNEHRRELAEKLFTTYDLDCSSFIDLDEFVKLMTKLDPTMSRQDIKGSMEASGAIDDGMNKSQFYHWINHMFQDFDERDYDDCMSELMNFVTELREETLSELGLAFSAPQTVCYDSFAVAESITPMELVCRETARFSTGPVVLIPSDARGADLTFEIDPRSFTESLLMQGLSLVCACRLPLGLILNEAGTIAGTPELGTSGKQSYVLTATNKQGSATCRFAITVKAQGRRLKRFGTVAAKMQRQATGFGNHRTAEQTVTRNVREQIDILCSRDIVGDGENKESVDAMLQKLEAEKSKLNKQIAVITVMKDREQRAAENADCKEYLKLLHTADTTDFSTLKSSEYLHIVVDPALERPLVIWVAKKINVDTLNMDLILMHLCYSLDKVTRKPYTCVIDLSDAESENCTSMPWLNKVRTLVPRKNQSNAMELVIVGATVTTKIKVSTFKPLVSAPMWDNFSYLDNFDELCSHFEVSPDFWPDCMNPKKLEEAAMSEKVAAALAAATGGVSGRVSDGASAGANGEANSEEGAAGGTSDPVENMPTQVESADGRPEDSSLFGSSSLGGFPQMDESMNLFDGASIFGNGKVSDHIKVLQEQIRAHETGMSQNVDTSTEALKSTSEAMDDLHITLIQLLIESLSTAMARVEDFQKKLCIKHVIDALESKFATITQARQYQADHACEEQPLEMSTKQAQQRLPLMYAAISACREIFVDDKLWSNDMFADMDRAAFTYMQHAMEHEAQSLEQFCAAQEEKAAVAGSPEPDQILVSTEGSMEETSPGQDQEASSSPDKAVDAESSLVSRHTIDAQGGNVAVNMDDSVIFGVASPRSQAPLPAAVANSNEDVLLSYREAQQSELEMLTKELEQDPLIKKQLRAQQLANQLNQIDQVLSVKTVNRKSDNATIEMPGLETAEPGPDQLNEGKSIPQVTDEPRADPRAPEESMSFFSSFSFGKSDSNKAESSDAQSKEQKSRSFFSFGSSDANKEEGLEVEHDKGTEEEGGLFSTLGSMFKTKDDTTK